MSGGQSLPKVLDEHGGCGLLCPILSALGLKSGCQHQQHDTHTNSRAERGFWLARTPPLPRHSPPWGVFFGCSRAAQQERVVLEATATGNRHCPSF